MPCIRDMSRYDELDHLEKQMLEVQNTENYHYEAAARARVELNKVTTKKNTENAPHLWTSPDYLEAEITLLNNILQHHREAIASAQKEFQLKTIIYSEIHRISRKRDRK